MGGFQFPGGIESIDVDDTGSFDTEATTDPSSFVVSFGKADIVPDGTEFPDPEALTGALADGREGRLGLDQNMSMAVKRMDMTDFGTLEINALQHTDLYVPVTSQATTQGGSPLYKVVYGPVIFSDAKMSPVNVDRESARAFHFAGIVTGYRFADLATVTLNGT